MLSAKHGKRSTKSVFFIFLLGTTKVFVKRIIKQETVVKIDRPITFDKMKSVGAASGIITLLSCLTRVLRYIMFTK